MRASKGKLFEQFAIDTSLDRASIHMQASRGFLVASDLSVHERAVTPQELINRQRSLGDVLCQGAAAARPAVQPTCGSFSRCNVIGLLTLFVGVGLC